MTAAVLFVTSATLIVATGLVCYRQGRRDAIVDVEPFTQLGAQIFHELGQATPGPGCLALQFEPDETGTHFVARFTRVIQDNPNSPAPEPAEAG